MYGDIFWKESLSLRPENWGNMETYLVFVVECMAEIFFQGVVTVNSETREV